MSLVMTHMSHVSLCYGADATPLFACACVHAARRKELVDGARRKLKELQNLLLQDLELQHLLRALLQLVRSPSAELRQHRGQERCVCRA
jgi:hypothetical protein